MVLVGLTRVLKALILAGTTSRTSGFIHGTPGRGCVCARPMLPLPDRWPGEQVAAAGWRVFIVTIG